MSSSLQAKFPGGQIRLDQICFASLRFASIRFVRLDQIRLDLIRLDQTRLDQIRLDNRQIDRQIDRQIHRQIDRWIDGSIDCVSNCIQLLWFQIIGKIVQSRDSKFELQSTCFETCQAALHQPWWTDKAICQRSPTRSERKKICSLQNRETIGKTMLSTQEFLALF